MAEQIPWLCCTSHGDNQRRFLTRAIDVRTIRTGRWTPRMSLASTCISERPHLLDVVRCSLFTHRSSLAPEFDTKRYRGLMPCNPRLAGGDTNRHRLSADEPTRQLVRCYVVVKTKSDMTERVVSHEVQPLVEHMTAQHSTSTMRPGRRSKRKDQVKIA